MILSKKILSRLGPLVIALAFAGFLYLFVVDRDTLKVLVNNATPTAQQPNNQTAEVAVDQPPERPSQPPSQTDTPTNVVVIPVKEGEVEISTTFAGTSRAARSVDVRSQTSGLVISEPTRKGAQVAAGEILCQLDPGTREVTLQDALIRLESAELNAENAEQLAANGYGTETERIATQSILQSALAAVEAAQKEIERLTITAPFDGLMESDAAEYGSLLQPGSLCATIIQINPVKVVGYVSQMEVGNLQVGDTAKVNFISGLQRTGDLTFISRQADNQTKTFEVEITVLNDDYLISDGFSAEVTVIAGTNRAHFIPQSSFTLNDAGELGVRVVEENIVNFYPIELIKDTLSGAWVSGLPQTVDLIIVGQEFVIEGNEVQKTYQEEVL